MYTSTRRLLIVIGLAGLAGGLTTSAQQTASPASAASAFKPVNADGSAGALVPIETSIPFTRPDGLRTVGPQTLLQAEGQGRVAELTIKGTRADVRVLQEGLTGASAVTVVGNSAVVLVERAKGVAVSYRAQ
jgi:hypothetical protein